MELIKFRQKFINSNGSVLVLGLLVISIMLLFGGIFLGLTLNNYNLILVDSNTLKSYWYAYAGVKEAIYNLRNAYYENDFKIKKKEFEDGYNEVVKKFSLQVNV